MTVNEVTFDNFIYSIQFGSKLVTVITNVMELLIKLTVRNHRSQELLFENLDLLLSVRERPELLANLLFRVSYNT